MNQNLHITQPEPEDTPGFFRNLFLGTWSILYIPLILAAWVSLEMVLFQWCPGGAEEYFSKPETDLNIFNLLIMVRVGIMVGLVMLILQRSIRKPLSKIGLTGRNLGFNVVLGIVIALPVAITAYLINMVSVLVYGLPSELNPVINLFLHHDEGLWLLTLLGAVIIPFQEELVFRGFFYTLLRQSFGTVVSVLLVSIVFTVLHGIAVNFPAIFFLSMVLCLLYEYTGSIIPSIICHGLFNGISFMFLHILT